MTFGDKPYYIYKYNIRLRKDFFSFLNMFK